jgi:excinuclease ABC subunit C
VKDATVEQIAEVEGFGPKQAAAVFEFFHRPEPDEAAPGAAAPAEPPPGGEAVSEAEIDAALVDEADAG